MSNDNPQLITIISMIQSLSYDDRTIIYDHLKNGHVNKHNKIPTEIKDNQYHRCSCCRTIIKVPQNSCKTCYKEFCDQCAENELSVYCPSCTIGKCNNNCLYGVCRDCFFCTYS